MIRHEVSTANQLEERSRFRSSFIATLLFSSVQIYSILIRIVKSKFVALFIGPAGLGIQSLLHTTTETISSATNLGLNISSVKSIAGARREGNRLIIAKKVAVLRRLIWLTGGIGMLICALFAPIWSRSSFGSDEYVWSFIIVSTIILLEQLSKGESAVLQGLQEKKKLARASIIGQTLNAVVTIPLYYFYGTKAIVAALVIGALLSLLITRFFTRKLRFDTVRLTWKETFSSGMEMMKLGFFLSLQFLMQMVVLWVVRNYISHSGGVEDVGLYAAGTAIVTSYIGLVFSAISTDYFPRLAATRNNHELIVAVHTQSELNMLLLAPLLVAFITFCEPIIVLLYSGKFLPIVHMMCLSISAVLLQSMGWAIAYTLIAKAKPLYFFLNEVATTSWSLPLKLMFYQHWGLTGFGLASLLTYTLYLIQVMLVTKKLFGFKYDLSIWKLLCTLSIPLFGMVFLKLYASTIVSYLAGTVVFTIVAVFCFKQLDKKMDIKNYIKNKIHKRHAE